MIPRASPCVGPTKAPLEWVQMGDEIVGEAFGDESGHSVSLSNDGIVIAIGAWGNDGNRYSFKFYPYSDATGSWTHIGGDDDGEAKGDESGFSVSHSSDSTVVAIRAVEVVRIYKYRDTTGRSWVQMGGDIVGESACDQSGRNVNLSNDGIMVAMGTNVIVKMPIDHAQDTSGSTIIVILLEAHGSRWQMLLKVKQYMTRQAAVPVSAMTANSCDWSRWKQKRCCNGSIVALQHIFTYYDLEKA